jgi:pullulanase/glycogen debranching enzyme
MKARSAIFKSKVHLLEEYVDKVSQNDAGDQQDLENNRNRRDSFRAAAHGIEGSKSVFAKQIMQIRETDLESLLNKINEYDQVANEKKSLYANYLELSGEPSESLDKMRT